MSASDENVTSARSTHLNPLASNGRSVADVLEERLRFERLLLELTAAFVDLPIDKIDEQIEHSLEQLARFLDVGRITFAEFSQDRLDMHVTHSYVAAGIHPIPKLIVDGQFPWYAAQIRRGEALRLARLPEDVPEEAVAERSLCLREGMKSNLAIPLKVSGDLRCVITFASFQVYREWPEDLVQRLWLIGQIFANSIARKEAEKQQQSLRDQLARLDRIALVGELAASITHEIRQPLCAILSNAQYGEQMCATENIDLSELRDILHDVADDGRRANLILTGINHMLRNEAVNRSPVQINDTIHEISFLIEQQLAQHRVTLALNLQENLPLVNADRVQLQQVILNLIFNAIDAMSGTEDRERRLLVQTQWDGTATLVTRVLDTGPGIADDAAVKIFTPFYTTKPAGIGVGLAISRSIVTAHQGHLWLDPTIRDGACFCISLPVASGTTT